MPRLRMSGVVRTPRLDLSWNALFRLQASPGLSLQLQIRQSLVAAVAEGRLLPGTRLPSSRELADTLAIARNTVVIAFQQLCEEGILVARERSGYFVAATPQPALPAALPSPRSERAPAPPKWSGRVPPALAAQRNIVKPRDWLSFPYPFLFGQFDPSLFPTNEWRECVRSALSVPEIHNWARDVIDGDDPELVEQVRLHVLPRRGIFAHPDEIIITLGAQNALSLVAQLLLRRESVVGIEDPGYPDARNLFRLMSDHVVPLPVDEGGLVVSEDLAALDYLFVTPGHHCPTSVPLRPERRERLLELAREHDIILIEDDYEGALDGSRAGAPALKSADADGRILFVGSLSKIVAPGLRLGYVVAPRPVAHDLRALRRLTLRHPPANNQRAAALFIGLGHFGSHVRRVATALEERAGLVCAALECHLPEFRRLHGPGSSSVWIDGGDAPADPAAIVAAAQAKGVLVERGDVFFAGEPRHCFRLGFSSIAPNRIESGIKALRAALDIAGAT